MKIAINLNQGSIVQESNVIVGIDLGTTNSLVAYIKDGKAVCVSNTEGKNTLVPSVLHFDAADKCVVGDAAKAQLVVQPERTIYSVKRLMGKSYNDVKTQDTQLGYTIIDNDAESLVKVRIGNRFFTPIELSAEILGELKRRIEAELKATVRKAVITVPAYFNDTQRQATRDAGKLAGLEVLRIVNEPTAAALAYGIGLDPEKAETVAVFDLGGGTFDISILKIEDGIFEVVATNGDTYLGGDDFDKIIVDEWLAIAKQKDIALDANDHALLRKMAEAAKKALSTQDSYTNTGADKFDFCTITKTEFEMLCTPLIAKTIAACRNALTDAQMTTANIDKIIMVGGSTRMAMVQNAVAEFFGKPLYNDLNPDEVVALGAAVQADILAGNNKDLLLLDVTPLSLGIETIGGLMDVIIPRNTKVPARFARSYTTSVDGQANLKIAVYQGERDLIADNRKLGEFVLKGVPAMPAAMPKIEISFILDADGILKVKAQELRSGVQQTVEMRSQYGITEEEMGMMLLDSIRNAQQDMAARALLEARNEANNVILASERFLKQNASILAIDEVISTEYFIEALRKAVATDKKDLINAEMAALNEFTEPLAHRAMDVAIKEAMTGKKI
jgi:molecular chaperone HscA